MLPPVKRMVERPRSLPKIQIYLEKEAIVGIFIEGHTC